MKSKQNKKKTKWLTWLDWLRRKTRERRNWLDLPEDVLSKIFEKLGGFDIIYSAQFVCSAWQKLSKHPHVFRFIHLENTGFHVYYKEGMTRETVQEIEKAMIDRSCGQLVGLSTSPFCTEETVYYALEKPQCSLKSLHLSRRVPDGRAKVDKLLGAIANAPFLEELSLSMESCTVWDNHSQLIAAVGGLCPRLKYFSWCGRKCTCNCHSNRYASASDSDSDSDVEDYVVRDDKEMLAIVKNMPQLRHLRLAWHKVTDKVLKTILDGCQYLEHLELEFCKDTFFLNEELLNQCRQKFKTLTLPRYHIINYYRRRHFEARAPYEEYCGCYHMSRSYPSPAFDTPRDSDNDDDISPSSSYMSDDTIESVSNTYLAAWDRGSWV